MKVFAVSADNLLNDSKNSVVKLQNHELNGPINQVNRNARGKILHRFVNPSTPGELTLHESMTYDIKLRLLIKTESDGQVTEFEYDELNRVIETNQRGGAMVHHRVYELDRFGGGDNIYKS